MPRKVIGKRNLNEIKGIFDISEQYEYNYENKWSDYLEVSLLGQSTSWDTPDGYRTVIWTGGGSFQITSSGDKAGFEYFIVGGGGGGGTGVGAGGGGGSVKSGRITGVPGFYAVSVGSGGAQSLAAGGPTGNTSITPRDSFPGSTSSITGTLFSVYAGGGGGGGSQIWSLTGLPGINPGGSGGGGTTSSANAFGLGAPGNGDGFPGGIGHYTLPGNSTGAGGGGRGGVGGDYKNILYTNDGWVHQGGDGGQGVRNTMITDSNTPTTVLNTYFSFTRFCAGGGGGGCSQPGGAYAPSYIGKGNGRDGGGDGAVGFANGQDARLYTGSGGGGGGQTDFPYRFGAGGAGGPGIVMIRYRFKPTNLGENIIALAEGGSINLTAGDGYVYHTFKSSGVFRVLSQKLQCEILVVGGGGAASSDYSGGGGGGGINWETAAILSKGSYTATVGAGGAVGSSYNPRSSVLICGNPSSIAYLNGIGGGGGGHIYYFTAGFRTGRHITAKSGGSGGGEGYPVYYSAGNAWQPTNQPITQTSFNFGFPGGNTSTASPFSPWDLDKVPYAGGGGGGAGGYGVNGGPGTAGLGGAGGPGAPFTQFPLAKCGNIVDSAGSVNRYAGGGAGFTPPLNGGIVPRSLGGGGGTNSRNGDANLGGGGAHGSGQGGSGVIIIRYKPNDPDFPYNKL